MQSYKDWIWRWLGLGNSAGALAKRIYHDKSFPVGGDFKKIEARLKELNMTDDESIPFYAGWKNYEADKHKNIRERSLENTLVEEVQQRGGLCWKFISPSANGVPDRIVLLPNGLTIFVEMKAPGRPLQPLQKKRAEQLRDLGFRVYCLDSNRCIRDFIVEVFTDEI